MTHSAHRQGTWLYRTFALFCLLWLSQVFAIAQAAPVISPASGTYLGSVPLNQSFSVTLTATAGSGGYQGWYECDASDINYDPTAQCMPTGLVINESFGSATTTISGTPTVAGHYDFYVSVYDGNSLLPGVARYTLDVGASSTPTLTGISPNSGSTAGGTSVTLTGTNLTGATAVTIGGTAATSVSVVNATTITATTPAHAAGAVNVVVTTPSGSATLTNGYTYVTPAPTLSNVSPNNGSTAGGTSVTLTGTNLTGATAVTIGGTAATSVTVVNATTITATTPAHAAGAVNVVVTTPGGTATLTNAYTYVTPTPTLSNVSPNNGTTAGGTSVTLTGTNFSGATGVTFGGLSATGIVVVNATTITATTPANAAGAVNVVVTTPGGTATLTNGYTYVTPAPTLTGASPNSGSTGGSTSVTLTGTNLIGTTGVTFGGSAATGVTINSSTSVTVVTPAHAAGAVDVVLSTPGGTATLVSGYTYVAPSPPVAGAVSVTVAANSSANPITLNLSGGTATSVAVASGPSQGTTNVSGTSITYTPTAGYSGGDSFTYTATGPGGTSAPATVTITINAPTLVISPSSLPNATASNAYSQTLSTANGATPYSYVVTSGAVPPGLSLASGGVLSGTPSAVGTFNFTVTSTDAHNATGSQAYSLTVVAATIAISPTTLGPLTAGTAYSQTLSATGGNGSYTWSTAGSLPPGITVSSGGVVSGTPTSSGNYSFTVTATDSLGSTGSRGYAVTVNDQAPVANNSTLTVQGGSNNNPVALNLTGGSVSQVSIVSNASNGTATATGTTILFTPAAGFAGTDSFTYNATGPGGTSNTATVSVTVTAPTISITPATLTNATQNTAYSQTLTASGSSGSYAFSVVAGSLPAGMNLSAVGSLSGTPTAAGTSNFTVRAMSSSGFFGDQAYTLTVNSLAPVAGAVSLSVAANSSANPVTLNLSGGAATSVSVSSAPTHGTTSVSGTSISYTPTAGYSGPDSFSYIATGAGGSSSAATVSITVLAPTLAITPATPALPAATQNAAYSQSLSTSGGTAPYSFSVTSGALPAGLTLDASGSLSGTPTAVATSNFTVTVTDANGATGSRAYSLEVAAQSVVVPPSSEAVEPGQTATVDLTRGATGGPFTSATLLSVSPPSAGTARMTGPFTMSFVPAAGFSGSAVVSFSLLAASGAVGNSFVTFAVQTRPDPTKDAEVIGLLNAQSRAAERFASTQMDNFNRRLEQLHRPTCDRNSFNASVRHGRDDVSLGSLGKALRDELDGNGKGVDEDDDEKRRQERDSSRATTGECREEALAFWTDGFVNTGSNRARGAKDNSFTTYGLSAGMDYRLSPRAVVGVGFGYGNDRADIGEHDTRSEGDALGLAAYLSVNPLSEVYIDALLGYNRISFDSRRYVTADPSNGYAHGSRDADQLFASLTASYEYRQGSLSLAPYARINSSYTKLDAFSERGGGAYALTYEEQTLRYFTSFVGVRSGYDIDTRFGVLTPRVGLAWGHNFSRNQDYRMRYADQGSDGVLYRLSPDPMDTNFMDLDTGLDLTLGRSWRLGFSYKTALGTNERNEMFRIGLDGKF
ncbi:autotransporter domain-containing protein [Pseudomonas xanthosomatis]|uniref:putative Ig domain-containing protein n=1 Tax=Pseudomonas xanthosomatis TaxID=2842356 RepID=UPI001C3C6E5F|nr:putative Ig domain-containing protein [Pseudomonas xanthosomatis]QXH44848.1 autotransporter domain-containing protein [Pseudomonas xanthosomatis]